MLYKPFSCSVRKQSLYKYKYLEPKWEYTWYYIKFYYKLQYFVVVKILLMQNLIYKKNLLVNCGTVKSLNFAIFLLESASSSNFSSLIKLYCKIFGKFEIFCLRLYLESLFPSWHLQQKFLKLVFFNSEEEIADWSWLLNQS